MSTNKKKKKIQGLPLEWEALLKSSGISRDEVLKNADDVLKVLEFQAGKGRKGTLDNEAPKNVPLPEESSVTLGAYIFFVSSHTSS